MELTKGTSLKVMSKNKISDKNLLLGSDWFNTRYDMKIRRTPFNGNKFN